MFEDNKKNHRDIRRKLRELEEVKPNNFDEYVVREEKIRKLLELLR